MTDGEEEVTITEEEKKRFLSSKARLRSVLLSVYEYNYRYVRMIEEDVMNYSDDELKDMQRLFDTIVSRLDTDSFVEKREDGWYVMSALVGDIDIYMKSLMTGQSKHLTSKPKARI